MATLMLSETFKALDKEAQITKEMPGHESSHSLQEMLRLSAARPR